MASRDRHLDASSGREVVLCHRCRHEWYRDLRTSLNCPLCNSEAVEIVEPGNDPREIAEFSFPSSLSSDRSRQRRPGTDSDPEEDDIEDHIRPGAIPRSFGQQRPNRGSAGGQGDSDVILRRFADMLINDLGGARPPRSGPEPLFPLRGGQSRDDDFDQLGIFPPGPRSSGAPATYRHTTFRSGPVSGTATFTIVSSSVPEGAAPPGFPPGFPALFGQIMNNASPPSEREDRPGGAPGARPMPGGMGFATGLHEILASLLNPQAAVHGDAVYTQEALDRIITSLMEANPSSNAAPPASQTAIERLEKKQVDEDMLGPERKAECTICIDELHKGDEVTVLPCSHWFHGECVILWLKEHNTCPICRAPIEERGGQSSSGAGQQPQATRLPETNPYRASLFTSARPRQERYSRTPQENDERLNAIRNLNYASASPTNDQVRRNSLSPASTRDQATSGSRRVRSPSLSQDQDLGASQYDRGDYLSGGRHAPSRDTRDRANDRANQSGQSSSNNHGGAFSWIRDHLTRSSSNNAERDKDRRR